MSMTEIQWGKPAKVWFGLLTIVLAFIVVMLVLQTQEDLQEIERLKGTVRGNIKSRTVYGGITDAIMYAGPWAVLFLKLVAGHSHLAHWLFFALNVLYGIILFRQGGDCVVIGIMFFAVSIITWMVSRKYLK